MSIIVTQINKDGIVFATDSNISTNTQVDREDKKIFEIAKLKSALCIAGAYSVGGVSMNEWMPKFIISNSQKYNSLSEFVKLLSDELTQSMLQEEKNNLLISHIAGYQGDHIEMWCLSNTTLLENGQYSSGDREFHYSEDFWNRDYKNNNLEKIFKGNGLNYQIYVNAVYPGRVAFNVVRNYLDLFFSSLWLLQNFKFRHPKNIDEHKSLVKLYIEAINTSYLLSEYEPKIIGGEVQLYTIQPYISIN